MTKTFTAATLGATFLSLAAFAPAEAADRRVRIINNTSLTMTNFQASNVRAKTWEEDILGRRVLNSGDSVVINIDDRTGSCFFDFRATFENGQQAIRRRVNVCTTATYTYND